MDAPLFSIRIDGGDDGVEVTVTNGEGVLEPIVLDKERSIAFMAPIMQALAPYMDVSQADVEIIDAVVEGGPAGLVEASRDRTAE